jgi:dTDP-4-dehydrorhamnose reductase
MKRVVVTGAAGQLGSTVVARLSGRCEVCPFARAELDIADQAAVLDRLTTLQPDVVINCAAYNDVDGAEDNAIAALRANATGVLSLARAAHECGATLVHYSTDFVFDGETDRPYLETDPPRPLGSYASSKLLGEWFALELPASYVLRVESLFGGGPAKSSIDLILKTIEAGQPVRAFSDRTVTPSYVDDVAAATEALLEHRAPFGLYHCVNSGVTTWVGVAAEAARLLQREAEIVPIRLEEMKRKARRPRYCALANDKLAAVGISMPPWKEALARHIRRSRGQ